MQRTIRRATALLRGLVVVLVAAGSTACITRSVDTVVVEDPNLEVVLRKRVKWFTPVDRDYQHPLEISPRRLMNVLASIDVETPETQDTTLREPALPDETLVPVARAVSKALSEADPTQQVVVKAMRKERRLGLFHRKYLTTFITYGKDDLLYFHFRRVNWKIPKRDEEQGKIPDPRLNRKEMDFKVRQTAGLRPVGAQEVAVRWRDPVFAESRRIETGAGGTPQRRTILMDEELPEDESLVTPGDQVENMSPEVLRALADLEEARRAGSITEAEYQARRYDILREGAERQP